MTKITPDEFKVLAKYVHGLSGIYLDDSKMYLVETRLYSLLDEIGCASYSELYYRAKSDRSGLIPTKIIDAISTNETFFFREASLFTLLQNKVLPDLIDKRRSKTRMSPLTIKIWSAACATGQEVYSIAMTVKELGLDSKGVRVKILGTDISDAAIARASYGQYNKFEIDRGLPSDKLQKYFVQNGSHWRVKDEVRALATFRKLNLLDQFVGMDAFDIILCRNVAIYFTMEHRIKLFSQIVTVMEPDGYLFLGSTESLAGISDRYDSKKYMSAVFYQLKPLSGTGTRM